MGSILRRVAHRFAEPVAQHLDRAVKREIAAYRQQIEELKVLQGRALAQRIAERRPLESLHEAEFKVFSQFGEDGILQYLAREAGIGRDEQVFIEFGVQHYAESNTRFLLLNNNWRGLILDASARNIESVRAEDIYWRHDLTAVAAWIDRDNIDRLILDAGFRGRIGLLSIDIDGNDYWVWDRIEVVEPVIVVVEWNSVYGPRPAVSIPYDRVRSRQRTPLAPLLGCLDRAFERRRAKGYALVGSNSAGNNLFSCAASVSGACAPQHREAYVESRFRDSRAAGSSIS